MRLNEALEEWPRPDFTSLEHGDEEADNGCRWLIGPPGKSWIQPVLSEWELTNEGWEDQHPHDETTYVLEGELFVEAGGGRVVLRPGDVAVVRAGHLGRYLAPKHARMMAIYGPNPDGKPTLIARSLTLDAAGRVVEH